MKHIQKKYLFEDNLKKHNLEDHPDYDVVEIKDLNNEYFKKARKSRNVIIETSLDEKIFAFIYDNNGKHITIPIPDFTLVYYDFAYKLNAQRKQLSKDIFEKLNDYSKFSEVNSDLLYNFYGYSSSCIINLFTSIESFINSMLPVDQEYKNVLNNKTEIYNREQIQLNISFFDKLKKVLPQFYNKNFFLHQTLTNQHIYKLKELRDKIIHTKSDSTGELQIEIFRDLLKFKYDDSFEAVKKLINFYKVDYIVDCSCNKDF
ncbi:hypothetical protein PGH12_01340 [Chryseobacterium wangxinyae]|uniref:hypothetical protein n=1 Tax=Chryseobacterium sp. CY350 TaxID=2997336 RepID=UPI002270D1AA|nr:hypothetical protein [Chryseobacterium sp. CY350]MCY0977175.1 hypothetical protein [Chryseobacterium sp. CY350]WBZ95804.1 hypothetical protein PGH12_01340 [Chryseobacterium sp. CY350]